MTLFNFVPSGTVLPFAGASAPAGWLICDGSAISRTTYPNLFAAISIAHGSGDGSTTFNIPDLRGRFMRGVDGTAGRDPDKTGRLAAASGGNTGNAVGSVQTNATAKNGLINSTSVTSSSGNRNQFDRTSGTTPTDHSHGTGDGGNHSHFVCYGNFGGDDFNLFDGTNSERVQMADAPDNDIGVYADWVGNHNHGSTGGHSVNHSHTTTWDSTFSVSGTTPAQTISGDNETRPVNANMNFIIKI